MSGNFRKEDLRIIKTYNALLNSFNKLIEYKSFGKITVNDLCEEALISRATFYTHFDDKYDLLKYWLNNIKQEFSKYTQDTEQMIIIMNQFLDDKQKIIKNILLDANSETLELLHMIISSFIDDYFLKDKSFNSNHMILSTFCSGGLINLLSYQMNNKSSPDFKFVNLYLINMLSTIMEWNKKQK